MTGAGGGDDTSAAAAADVEAELAMLAEGSEAAAGAARLGRGEQEGAEEETLQVSHPSQSQRAHARQVFMDSDDD